VKAGRSFEQVKYPPPPQWDRRAIKPNQKNVMSTSALVPM
jgi:hypothetical protein